MLYLLHGGGDNEEGWTTVGRANFIADNLLARKKAVPMIIAMPFGHVPEKKDLSEQQWRRHRTASFQKDLLGDVIDLVESNYRTINDAQHRAMAGLSMGGGQTVNIGLANLDKFTWLGAFSSAVRKTDIEDRIDKLFEDPDFVNSRLNLFWIGCGNRDFLFDANKKFIEYLEQKNIKHAARFTEGKHTWIVWRRYLGEFLPLLFKSQ